MKNSKPPSDRAQSLYKGLQILQCFGDGTPAMTLTEVADAVLMNKATARRFLLTLLDMGYLTQHDRYFRLTTKVMTLGYNYLSSLPWWDMAQPIANEVATKLNESCSISMISNETLVFVARVQGSRALTLNTKPGRQVPTWCTSVGRVLLAEIDEKILGKIFHKNPPVKLTQQTLTDFGDIVLQLRKIKSQGYAIVDQELEVGLVGVAAPVKDKSNEIVAAIGVSAHAQHFSEERLYQEILPTLIKAAANLGQFMT